MWRCLGGFCSLHTRHVSHKTRDSTDARVLGGDCPSILKTADAAGEKLEKNRVDNSGASGCPVYPWYPTSSSRRTEPIND